MSLKHFGLPIIELHNKVCVEGSHGVCGKYSDLDNPISRSLDDFRECYEDLDCVPLETTFYALSALDDKALSAYTQDITEDEKIGDQIFQCIREKTAKAKRFKKFKAIIEENNLSTIKLRPLGHSYIFQKDYNTIRHNAHKISEENAMNALALLSPNFAIALDSDNGNEEAVKATILFCLSIARALHIILKQRNLSYTSKKELAQIEASPYVKFLDDLGIEPLYDLSPDNFMSTFTLMSDISSTLAQSVPVDNSADMLNGLNLFIDQNFDFINVNKVAFMDTYRAGLMEFVGSIKSVIELYSFAALFFPVKYGRGKGNSDIIKPGKRLKGIYWKNEPADIEGVIRILKDNRYFNHLPNEASVDKKSVEPGRRLTYLSKQAKKGHQWIIDFITEYWNNEPASDFLEKYDKK
jgi:hypothetical protein